MKVLVAHGMRPFERGRVDAVAERLISALREAGHAPDLLRLPVGRTAPQTLDAVLAASLLQPPNAERLVALSFPAHLVPHDDVVLWLLDDPSSPERAEVVRTADRHAFAEATRVHVSSQAMADRLRADHDVTAHVLPDPQDGTSWAYVVEELTR